MAWLEFLEHHVYAPRCDSVRITHLRATATPGEQVSLSVSIAAATRPVTVEMSAADLHSSSGVMPQSAIDLFVARVWDQAGVGLYQAAPVAVAELLVKDDRELLSDGYTTRCEHWWHWRRRNYYRPPDVRLTGLVRTSLVPATPKLVWASVKIPNNAVPGLYTGGIEVRAVDAAWPPARLGIEIEVLPIALAAPQQDLMLWYKGTLNCRLPRHHVTEAIFTAQLRDIYDHGFTSLSLTEDRPHRLQRALDIAASIGFRRNVVLVSPFPTDVAAINFHEMKPIYFISDQPDIHGLPFITAHVRDWQRAQRQGVSTMSALSNAAFARRFASDGDIGHAPDVLLLFLPTNLTYFAATSAGVVEEYPAATYYYWHPHMEKPLLHRVLAGIYLWKSRAQGIAPYCYQHLPLHPSSPYDDFDEWEPNRMGDGRVFKDHMTTYPARSGTIPTLQWKALSDGLCDLRYLATLDAAIATAAKLDTVRARGLVDDVCRRLHRFLDRVSLSRIEILSDVETAPYPDLTAHDLVAFRSQLIADIVELQSLQPPRP